MWRCQRAAIELLGSIQKMVDDECRSADGQLRGRLGLVLLDVDYRVERAMELEIRHGSWHPSLQGVGSGLQLYTNCVELPWAAGGLLRSIDGISYAESGCIAEEYWILFQRSLAVYISPGLFPWG